MTEKQLEVNSESEDRLTPDQVRNWRKILCRMLGPYAFVAPVVQIRAFRDKFQKDILQTEVL